MIELLDPQYLRALTPEGPVDISDKKHHHFILYLTSARKFFAQNKVGEGVIRLLDAFPIFEAQLRYDKESACDNDSGCAKWQIVFRKFPFRIYHITPGEDGSVIISSTSKLLRSFQMLGQSCEWQAMIQWLWKAGNKRQIARSIEPLDPKRLNALVNHDENDYGDNSMDYHNLCGFWFFIQRTNLCEAMLRLLNAFGTVFRPGRTIDKGSGCGDGKGFLKWCIYFPKDSLFSNVLIKPAISSGIVDIFTSGKLTKSFQMIDSPLNWKAFLEWMWEYGNKRHMSKPIRKSSAIQPKTNLVTPKRRHSVNKPLLHQALRAAGFKAQRELESKTKLLNTIKEEGSDRIEVNLESGGHSQGQPLLLANHNKQLITMEQAMDNSGVLGGKVTEKESDITFSCLDVANTGL